MTAQEYFEAHTLNSDYLEKTFAIQFDEEKITIPIYDQTGKLLYCKFRHLNSKTKFSFEKGGHPALFCSHKITKHGSVVLCEGEPDAMRLWQAGIPAVTGTSGVATFNAKLAEPLRKMTVYLCLDNDEAGQKEIEQYCEVLGQVEATVKIVSLPEGFKDVSEFLSASQDKQGFLQLMDRATDLDTWLDRNEPEEFALESNQQLLDDDVPQDKWLMDRILPLEGFCFIVGPEACGKSFYTLGIAQSVAYGKPWLDKFAPTRKTSVLFIDKENTRSRIQSRLKGLDFNDPEHKIWRVKFPRFFELSDSEGKLTPFAKAVQRKVKGKGIGLVIIDSFTDVMVGNENARDDTQAFFDGMRIMFPEISILVLHHISKPQAGSGKTGGQLVRGSTNINAQIYSGFLVAPVPKAINEFTIEQIKSGDAPKLTKFKVNLVSQVDPVDTNNSYVSKVMYAGEVEDEDIKTIEAIEIIGNLLDENIEIYKEDMRIVCQEKGISERTMNRAVKTLVDSERMDSRRADSGNKKVYFRPIEKQERGYNVNNDNDD